jgi:glycosyltransferase involved in cell wall biosynthesis
MVKKVLVVGDYLKDSGVTRYIFNTFGNITNKQLHFDALAVAGSLECEKQVEKMGWRYYSIEPANQGIIRHIREWRLFLSKHGQEYDAIHFNYSAMWNFVPVLLAKYYGVKQIVINSHNTYFGTAGSKVKLAVLTLLHKFGRFIVSNFIATNFIAVSDEAAKWLFSKRIYTQKKYWLINNGINLMKFRYNAKIRESMRKEFQFDGKVVYGHIGVFEQRKNHRFLIDIFDKIVQVRPDSILLLLGDGPLLDEIKNMVVERNLSDNVRFLGVKTNVSDWYQVMDAIIFPSIHEGLSTVLVEAQDSGLPFFPSREIPLGTYVKELVHPVSLQKSASEWRNIILDNLVGKRRSYDYELKQNGYDQSSSVKLLEKLYAE